VRRGLPFSVSSERDSVRKSVWPVLLLLALGILFGLVRGITKRPMPDLAHYERVQLGMTIREVQALLGPGRPVTQAEVPCLMELMTLPVAPPERKPASRLRSGRSLRAT
jgi:hypothetical protein